MQIDFAQTDIYLAMDSPDFRKQIDGLMTIVVEQFSAKINAGIFVFINRAKNKVKILCWHHNGFTLIYKRLEKGKFTMLKESSDSYRLSQEQFNWLFKGYDWVSMSDMNTPDFSIFYE